MVVRTSRQNHQHQSSGYFASPGEEKLTQQRRRPVVAVEERGVDHWVEDKK